MQEEKSFEFDAKVAEQLGRLFQTEALTKLRKQYFELFQVQPGQLVLDLGCGTGANAIALVESLQGNSRVIGIDNSEPMLAMGRHQLKTFAHPGTISLQSGDAHNLPFPDEYFDAAMIIQVLEYSKEPLQLLNETRRVLKKGGRVFLADTDWDTIVWNSNLKDRTRQVVANWSDHDADGWQGRKIPEYLKRAAFSNLTGGVYVITDHSFQNNSYASIVTELVTSYLIKSGKMSEQELEEWQNDLRAKDEAGHFLFSINRYAFVGLKT